MSASEIPPPSSPLHRPFRTEIVSDPHTYYAARLDQTERERMEMETSYRVLEMQKRTAEGKRIVQLYRISLIRNRTSGDFFPHFQTVRRVKHAVKASSECALKTNIEEQCSQPRWRT